jgi:hypothetical protein
MASSGFDVSPPEHPESYRLAIAWPGARCTLAADDWGRAEWVYWPWSGADPKLAADLATTLLTGRPGPYPRLGHKYGEEGITFKGLVGLELTARGLDVQLEVYTDEDFFDARAGITATATAAGADARVCVTDDGCLTWTREHWPQAATLAADPELYGWVTNPAVVAAAVVGEANRAMSLLRSSGQAEPGPSPAGAGT